MAIPQQLEKPYAKIAKLEKDNNREATSFDATPRAHECLITLNTQGSTDATAQRERGPVATSTQVEPGSWGKSAAQQHETTATKPASSDESSQPSAYLTILHDTIQPVAKVVFNRCNKPTISVVVLATISMSQKNRTNAWIISIT